MPPKTGSNAGDEEDGAHNRITGARGRETGAAHGREWGVFLNTCFANARRILT